MGYKTNDIRNIRTIKALRGESLTINLGKPLEGTITAWMKRSPDADSYRSFDVIESGQKLFLSKEKASDYYDQNFENLIESVEGKWYFDVEQVLPNEDNDTVKTVYRGTILFQGDITGSKGTEVITPFYGETFLRLIDTPSDYAGQAGRLIVVNQTEDALQFSDIDFSIVEDHIADLNNPHAVTKEQVGLSNADNTSDLLKPISNDTQAALDLKADDLDLDSHVTDLNNPHAVTKEQVGLSNADNTSDLLKPISNDTQAALDLKADDLDLDSHVTDLNNPHAVTKEQIGLSNADNTSDLLKPISNDTQAALDLKADDLDLDSHVTDLNNPHTTTISKLNDTPAVIGEIGQVLVVNPTQDGFDYSDRKIIYDASGLLFGGRLSINVDPTKLDIEAGNGLISDNYSTEESVVTEVSWENTTISIPNINTQIITYIAVDITGTVQLFDQALSQDELKDYIVLGAAVHPNLTTITNAANNPMALKDARGDLNDLIFSIGGLVNIEGNLFSPNVGTTTVMRTAGKQFGDSINWGDTFKTPNVVNTADNNLVTFIVVKSDGITNLGTTTVPVTQYEKDGLGILVDIPDNYFSTVRFYYSALTNISVLAYGQRAYDSLKKAVDNFDKDDFKKLPVLDDLVLRTAFVFKKDSTNFDNIDNFRQINSGIFGDKNSSTAPNNDKFAEFVEISDGMSYGRQDITYLEEGGIIYAEVEKQGSGDMIYVFKQSEHILNCTTNIGTGGKARIALTTGSATAPTENYIYVKPSTTVSSESDIFASTTFPTGEFGWVSKVLVPSVAAFLTEGVYSAQRFTDSKTINGRGALSYERERLRVSGAVYYDGCLPNLSINTAPAPDEVGLTVSSGEIYQLHKGTFRAFDIATDGIYIVNDPVTPWKKVFDLNEIAQDASGGNLNGSCFNLVLGGVKSSANGADYSKVFILLPSDHYNANQRSQAARDENNTSVTSVPNGLRSTAFLVARLSLRRNGSGNGIENLAETQSNLNFFDLRGTPLGGQAGGAGVPSVTEFTDDIFRVNNATDVTKQLAFNAQNIDTGTVRTMIVPNENGTIMLEENVSTDNTVNNSVLAPGVTATDSLDGLATRLDNYPLWTEFPNTEYIATPTSTNTIATSSDFSAFAFTKDVVRITLLDTSIVYGFLKDITASQITIFGDLLTQDISKIEFETGNNNAISEDVIMIPNDDIYKWGDARPAIRIANGAAPTIPSNLWGEDVFSDSEFDSSKGNLVYAWATAQSLDSSTTATEIEVQFDDISNATTFIFDALRVESESLSPSFIKSGGNDLVVNVTNPSGNKKTSGIIIHLLLFNDKDMI